MTMHRLSAVFQLLDGYRKQPALAAAPRFLLDGKPIQPAQRAQGCYVLLHLPAGTYQLAITTPMFQPFRGVVQVVDQSTLQQCWTTCTLEPGALYVYPANTTVIRGRVAGHRQTTVITAAFRTMRGRDRQVQTRAAVDGGYALALPGRLADPVMVTLDFTRDDGYAWQSVLSLAPGRTHYVPEPPSVVAFH